MIRNEPSSTLKLFCPAAGYLSQWAQVDPNLKVFRSSSIWECRHLSSKRVRKHIFPLSTNEYLVNKNVWISSTQHHTPAACWVLKSSVKKKYEKFWFELFHQMRSDLVWSLTPVFVTQLWTSCRPSTDKYVYPVADKYIQLHRQIYPVAHKYNQLHTNISN